MVEKIKILNLYSGIGGNRKLWKDVDVTAIEYDEEIAAIYKEYFPDDNVIITDAHLYLLKHYKEFDFIWSSRPCQTHSRSRFWNAKGGGCDVVYPDMLLYEEILFLKHYFEGRWVMENVVPYYTPLIKPDVEIDRHLFWANFKIRKREFTDGSDVLKVLTNSTVYGFDLSNKKITNRKDQILRNCVNPDLGLYILEQALGVIRESKNTQGELFKL